MPPPRKILVVDDDPGFRFSVRLALVWAGYVVTECRHGAEALDVLGREQPALVLLDVVMPEMDGWETLRQLRAAGHEMPVLMLSGENQVAQRVRGLNGGADDFLGKPFELAELLARLEALMRRMPHEPARARLLTFGPLVIDLERKVARRGDDPVKLTRTEYALLEFLVAQDGRPMSRESIMDAVWPGGATLDAHAFDTQLWRLRKKLGDTGERPRWLRNLSGVGYVLDC